jgi:hypothetical protein
MGGESRSGFASHTTPPAPPAEHQTLYNELSTNLSAYEAQIDSEWDEGVGEGRLAAGLATANGNKTVGLLNATNWTRTIEMLDAFEAMGVEVVKLDIQYPLFTPEFHTYLAANDPPLIPNYTLTVDYWVGQPASFYNKVVDELRARGLTIWIEHSTLFSDLNATPATPYFADMRSAGVAATRARYMQERIAEFVLIATELEPDYYTLADEPTTQNANFGDFPGNVPILTQDGWRDLARDGADAVLAAMPGTAMMLGAGSGTWESRAYTERFAALSQLDYVDFHHYPFATTGQSYNQNLLDWADYVRGVDPSKKITLGESWLYKASLSEVASGLGAYEIFGRDTYSFWEPLDAQYMDLMFKLTHHKDFELAMPFWTQYFFAYVDHGDPALEGLEDMELVGYAAQQAVPNIQTVTLTGTGERFEELLAAALDADGDGTPDSTDTGDADGDLIADNAEFACGSSAGNAARRPERIDGAFAGTDDDGDSAVNEALPPGSSSFDCDGDGYTGTAEANVYINSLGDQDPCGGSAATGGSGWPSDFVSGGTPNSTNKLTITDLTSFLAPEPRPFNRSPGDPGWNQRYDLVPGAGLFSKVVNINDVTALLAGFSGGPPMLAGARAFNHATGCPWAP